MKKVLLVLLAVSLSVSGFATAPWDKIFKPSLRFIDPYVTNYGAYIIGQWNQPNYAVQIQVSFDHSVPAPYYAVVQVFGLWADQPGGASYKQFTILFNTGQWYKSVNFHMASSEEAYTEVIDLLDYGPQ